MTASQAKPAPWHARLRARLRATDVPALLFLDQFLANPRMVGSVIPTAQPTIDRLLAPIDWQSVRVVVEYGPGTGVFTQALLDRLPRDAVLVAIDTNPAFISHLAKRIVDPRLQLVEGSAAEVTSVLNRLELPPADIIVSGLPFSTLPPGVDGQIMDATLAALREGGQFLVYQYSRYVADLLDARFATVEGLYSWRCIPPARLFWATKGQPEASA